MIRHTLLYIIWACLALTINAQPKQEVRAVWMTTFGGLDWPHSYSQSANSAKKQQQELCKILDQLQRANINTILFQSRIRGTVTFPSALEPWDGCLSGNPGVSPGYDALQFAIDECHKRGMELHAWVVTIPIGKWNGAGARNLRNKHPQLVKKIGADAFLNPEMPQTADYLATFCEDLTRRYDIDGLHLDYIRYPETWKISVKKEQGRHFITHIAETISRKVKAVKPWVKMSCSPIGKHDNLDRYDSYGWNAYSRVCQDAQGWLRSGIMDQLYPMMYFDGKHFYPFACDWSDNQQGLQVTAGLGVYMLSPKERNWDLSAVERQMNVCRQLGLGHAYFRSKFFTDNTKGIYDLACLFDTHPAQVPSIRSPFEAPSAPLHLKVADTGKGYRLTWQAATDHSNGNYLTYTVYASDQTPVDTNRGSNIVATRYTGTEIFIEKRADARPLHFAVTASDRYGKESPAAVFSNQSGRPSHESIFACSESTVRVSQQLVDNTTGQWGIYSMQGLLLTTRKADTRLNVSQLPEGFYELREIQKKDVTRRMGYFVIMKKK